MTDHFVGYVDGHYRAYRHVNGLYRLYEGPAFDKPRDAARYVDTLDSPLPTPRRADEPDPADGFWGAIASGDADRQPAGSPVVDPPPRSLAASE